MVCKGRGGDRCCRIKFFFRPYSGAFVAEIKNKNTPLFFSFLFFLCANALLMATPRQLELLATNTAYYFSLLVQDVIDMLYVFLFADPSANRLHLCLLDPFYLIYQRTKSPRYVALQPSVFLRKTHTYAQTIDKIENARIVLGTEFSPGYKWHYYPGWRGHEDYAHYSKKPLLALVPLREKNMCLVAEDTYSVVMDICVCIGERIIIPDRFILCTAILLDKDLLLHIEGAMADGIGGIWTYCRK